MQSLEFKRGQRINLNDLCIVYECSVDNTITMKKADDEAGFIASLNVKSVHQGQEEVASTRTGTMCSYLPGSVIEFAPFYINYNIVGMATLNYSIHFACENSRRNEAIAVVSAVHRN
jgi:hypothetical protein